MDRRSFLTSFFGMLLSGGMVGPAVAEDAYPLRPVRLIVPSQAGGVYDLMGRIWADRLSSLLGTIVVENRAGGSATVGVTAAARAPADGYTLLLASNATQILQPAMMDKPPYDPVKDFVPVSNLAASWTAVVVAAAVPVHSLRELIDYAHANPGKLNFGYAGLGDTTHIAGELLKQLAKLDIVGVPYRGMTPAIRELVSGHLHMGMPHITTQIVDLHRTGQVRILAVNAPERLATLLDIPTAIESGLADMTAATFFGLYAPAGTPRPILEKINALTRKGFDESEFQKKLAGAGFEPMVLEDLDKTSAFAERERRRWIPIAQRTGIRIN